MAADQSGPLSTLIALAPSARSPEIELLACPRCKGRLVEIERPERALSCPACNLSWPSETYPDFLANPDTVAALGSGWRERQDQMVDWYVHLLEHQESMAACLERDYRCVAPSLAGVSGRVLDLGGGAGVTRDYLPAATDYVNLDPSAQWLAPGWTAIERRFRSIGEQMAFVRGVGERLPLADAIFDVVLSLWSLNHASSAEATLAETARVLRPGGRLLLVLEDVEPHWSDLARLPGRRPQTLVKKLRSNGSRPWPVQSDHTAITEAELAEWTAARFKPVARRWAVGDARAPYLMLELERRL